MTGDVAAVLERLVSVLDGLGLRYAVGGSLASSLHGEPRSTNDVDVLVDLPAASVTPLLERVGAEFYASETAARRALETCSCFNLVHLSSGYKIDLFVAGPSALDSLQLESSQAVTLRSGLPPVRITSAAVLVLRKLAWYRSANETSERQWRDVLGILRVQGARLELDALRDLAAELELTALLDRALAEAAGSAGDRGV